MISGFHTSGGHRDFIWLGISLPVVVTSYWTRISDFIRHRCYQQGSAAVGAVGPISGCGFASLLTRSTTFTAGTRHSPSGLKGGVSGSEGKS